METGKTNQEIVKDVFLSEFAINELFMAFPVEVILLRSEDFFTVFLLNAPHFRSLKYCW